MSISLPLPSGVRLLRSDISAHDKTMVLFLCMTARNGVCPLCHRKSRRVHSLYWRSLADLPCMGTPVRWRLRIRRFFCDNPNCPRQTFSEALPSLASHHAQSTQRLREAQTCIGQAVGSRPGARVAQALQMPTSATTLLRLERSAPVPPSSAPHVLGVDDWAFRKGYRYGTILLDLERHHVVALLPDRSAESLSEWLKDHPGVEIVSRDRAGVYADGARQGVPNAVQVADRFHLLKNGVEALERLLGRHHRQIQEAASKVQAPRTPQHSAQKEVAPRLLPKHGCNVRRRNDVRSGWRATNESWSCRARGPAPVPSRRHCVCPGEPCAMCCERESSLSGLPRIHASSHSTPSPTTCISAGKKAVTTPPNSGARSGNGALGAVSPLCVPTWQDGVRIHRRNLGDREGNSPTPLKLRRFRLHAPRPGCCWAIQPHAIRRNWLSDGRL